MLGAKRWAAGVSVIALFLGLLSVRLVALEADPAPSLSADFLTDEGWWTRNARQTALFGTAPLDQYNPGLYSAPVYNAILTTAFRLAGVSFATARFVSALSACLTLLILGWLVLRVSGRRAALWTVSLLGFSAPCVLHNRTAFVESTLVLMLAGTFAATFFGLDKREWLVLAGALAALTLWTKPTGAHICALPILAVLLLPRGRSTRRRVGLALFLAGLLLGSLLPVLGVVLPHARDWLATNWHLTRSYGGLSLTSLPTGVLLFPRNQFWAEIAPVSLWLFEIHLRRPAPRSRLPIGEWEVRLRSLAGWWFILAAASTMIFAYQPQRRMLTLLPPLCLLLAFSFARNASEREIGPGEAARKEPLPPIARWIRIALLLWPTASLAWGGWVSWRVLGAGLPPRWALGGQVGGTSAALLLTAALILSLVLARTCETGSRMKALEAALARLAAGYFLWALLRWGGMRSKEFFGTSDTSLLVSDVAVAVVVLGAAVVELLRAILPDQRVNSTGRSLPFLRLSKIPAFVAAFAVGNVPMLLCLAYPSYTMGDVGRRVEEAISPRKVLVGPFADTVGLETGLRTVEARPHFGMNVSPFTTWPGAVLVTAVRHELQLGEDVPSWAPESTEAILDLPLCPNPWTHEPRFILRLRVAGGESPLP